MCDPITMGAMAVGSAVVGTVGALQAGHAASQAANYNAQMQMQNAEQAQRNAEIASQSGMANQNIQQLKTRAQIASTRANEGASGVGVNSGSFADVQQSEAVIGEMDSLTVRSRATREAYGYEVQGTNFRNQASLDREEGKQAKTASYFNAASTLLGGASNAAGKFSDFQRVGGLDNPAKMPSQLLGA